MGNERVYNFSAGPSMLPLEVLERAGAEITNYQGSGMSVMEMSHRSKVFQKIFDDTKAKLRALLNVPEGYQILFLQGGASTQFSMAHQDVRYYLNGMLFETEGEELRTVATDGHRLAVCSMPIGQSLPSHSVIVPRKGVIELMRMLDGGDNPLRVQIGSKNIRAHVGDFIFTSKLVDGRFPDYRRVLPKNPDKHLEAGCDLLKQAFARAAILSNEKFRGVRLYVSENQLKITANNPEQEEAEEILDVTYSGAEMEIGFNVSYVLDVLNALKCENVRMMLTDSVSSVQIEDAASQSAAYVVMPMRL